jgi:hypothetical protein
MAINKVIRNTKNGEEILLDLTGDTATEDVVFAGSTFHAANGEVKTGSFTLESEMGAQNTLISRIKAALAGKAAGGGSDAKPTQRKTVDITSNGTTEILPDDGFVLSGVTVRVNVPTGGGEDDVAALLGNTLTTLDNRNATSLKSRALQGSTKLVSVNLPSVTSMGTYAFYNCSGLLDVRMDKVTSIPSQCFYSCSKLQRADFGAVGSIAAQAFNACTALTVLILRKSDGICTLANTNAVANSGIGTGKGFVYVPRALLNQYTANANWSAVVAAEEFRAIEDYPEICG